MKRLTPDRENEIRKSDYIGTNDSYGAYCAVGELLDEINILRANQKLDLEWQIVKEHDVLKKNVEHWMEESFKWQKRSQEERAENEKLEVFYDTHVSDKLEADDLRAENERLKTENERLQKEIDEQHTDYMAVYKEMIKRGERIAKLKKIIVSLQNFTRPEGFIKRELEAALALAQDDEELRKT